MLQSKFENKQNEWVHVLYSQRQNNLSVLMAQKNSPPDIWAHYSYTSNGPWIFVELGEQLVLLYLENVYQFFMKENSLWTSKECIIKTEILHRFVWLFVVFLCSPWLKSDLHSQHEHTGEEIHKRSILMSSCALDWLCAPGPRRNKRSYPIASAISPVLFICSLCSINLNITIVTRVYVLYIIESTEILENKSFVFMQIFNTMYF